MDTVNDNKVVRNMILYDEVLTSKVATTLFLPFLVLLTITLVLPKGVKAVSVERYGKSSWSTTGRINATDANGTQTSYFLKARHLLHTHLFIFLTCLSMSAMSMENLNLKVNTPECLNCTILYQK